MSSLGQIVEFVRHSLAGFDASKDQVVELSSSVNETALTLPIDDVSTAGGAARGIAEVDLEVVRVKSIDRENEALVISTEGRGYRGTTAVAHGAGAEVRLNPPWPVSTVAREINGVIQEFYPRLHPVLVHETEFPGDVGAIDLPAIATGIIAVYVEDTIRPDQWVREDRWSLQPDSSEIGKALRLGGWHTIGDRIRVVYATRPGLFDLDGSLNQDFTDATGLDPRHEDLLRLGVAVRMAPFIDVARLPYLSAEAKADAQGRPPGSGAAASRLLYSMFQARLDDEARILDREHPIRVHFTGRA